METDNIHGNIERATELVDMFDFQDWVDAITETKETLPKYNVKLLNQKSIYTFKPLVQKQNWSLDTERNNVTWKKVKEIHVNAEEGNLIRVKYDYDGDYVTMKVNKPGHPVVLKTYQPPAAYEGNIPLSANTVKDLTYLCDNFHIPLNKQKFIRDVLLGVTPVEEEVVSDVEYNTDEEICNEESDNEDQQQESDDENQHEDEDDGSAHEADPPEMV